VGTAAFDSVNFMAGEYGVARGFHEERVVPEGRRHAYGVQVIDALLERLRRVSTEPFFAYTHLMEPHAPYDRGRREGTDWERYLAEIAVADREIGRVQNFLEHRFPGRWILLVSADHGEAFGEHGTFQHTKTLYDELLHVPLLASGPGIFQARTVEERVGLIDLGPTILDLFGVPTPATFEGQSLVPLLAGHGAPLTRPLCAEGRLRRALWMPDGMKVIEDLRRATVEAYDVTRDPEELHDLFDSDPDRAGAALATLRAFFAAHAVKRPGYRPPYKP
jgi:arylsulfatase A-like enzyme